MVWFSCCFTFRVVVNNLNYIGREREIKRERRERGRERGRERDGERSRERERARDKERERREREVERERGRERESIGVKCTKVDRSTEKKKKSRLRS